MTDRFTELADCLGSSDSFELHDVLKGKETAAISSLNKAGSGVKDDMQQVFLDAQGWLPFAAEKYLISAKLSDYVVVPVIIMPTDLPNRNAVAFPYTELTSFNPTKGMLAYKSWVGQPTHIDHVNTNIEAAKGVVLSSSMRKVEATKGKIWKVVCLCAFDRTKDAMLCNDILTGKRKEYSMGATVGGYSCSVCGVSPREGGCEHIQLANKKMQVFTTPRGKVLSYYKISDPDGFEVSSVGRGAYSSAATTGKSFWLMK